VKRFFGMEEVCEEEEHLEAFEVVLGTSKFEDRMSYSIIMTHL
jgi:hypothetical protein